MESKWSSLTENMGFEILRRLNTMEKIAFGLACKSWWTIMENNRFPEPPWLMGKWGGRFLCLDDGRQYESTMVTFRPKRFSGNTPIGSGNGWIIIRSTKSSSIYKRKDREWTSNVCLVNPFRGVEMRVGSIYHQKNCLPVKAVLAPVVWKWRSEEIMAGSQNEFILIATVSSERGIRVWSSIKQEDGAVEEETWVTVQKVGLIRDFIFVGELLYVVDKESNTLSSWALNPTRLTRPKLFCTYSLPDILPGDFGRFRVSQVRGQVVVLKESNGNMTVWAADENNKFSIRRDLAGTSRSLFSHKQPWPFPDRVAIIGTDGCQNITENMWYSFSLLDNYALRLAHCSLRDGVETFCNHFPEVRNLHSSSVSFHLSFDDMPRVAEWRKKT